MLSPMLSDSDRSVALCHAMQQLAPENRLVLHRCVLLMARFRECAEYNLMDAHNLAVVFGPNLMRAPHATTDLSAALVEGQLELEIVKALVSFPDYYFPLPYERALLGDETARPYPIPHLTEQDWLVIVSRARVRSYAPGTVILELGQPNTSVYRIKKGKAKVAIGAERVVVATLIDLDIFGDMSVLGNKVASATVLADTECECWVIDGEFLSTLLALEPLLGLNFYASLAREIASRIEQRTGYAQVKDAADDDASKDVAAKTPAKSSISSKLVQGEVPIKSFACAVLKPGTLHVFDTSIVHVTKQLGREKKQLIKLSSVLEVLATQNGDKKTKSLGEYGIEVRSKTPEFKLETCVLLFEALAERDQALTLIEGMMQHLLDIANRDSADGGGGDGGGGGAGDDGEFKRLVVKQPFEARNDNELTLRVGDIVVIARSTASDGGSQHQQHQQHQLCEQCGVGAIAASIKVNDDILRLCRPCVAVAQTIGAPKRADASSETLRPSTAAPPPPHKACQQCRKREAEARVTLPDGIKLKVCNKCIEGFRHLETLADKQAQQTDAHASPEQQIKELKMQKMVLSGRIGGLQRSLSGADPASSEYATLRAQMDKLTAEMRDTDNFIAALSKVDATSPRGHVSSPSLAGRAAAMSGAAAASSPNLATARAPAKAPEASALATSAKTLRPTAPAPAPVPKLPPKALSVQELDRNQSPPAKSPSPASADAESDKPSSGSSTSRKARKHKEGRRHSEDMPADAAPVETTDADIDAQLSQLLLPPPLPVSPRPPLSGSGSMPPPPPLSASGSMPLSPGQRPASVAPPPPQQQPPPPAVQPPPPVVQPPPPAAQPPPPAAQPPPPAAQPPPPAVQPPPPPSTPRAPAVQPPPPSTAPPTATPPAADGSDLSSSSHRRRHRKHRSKRADGGESDDEEPEFQPPPPPGRPPGPQGREGKPGEAGASSSNAAQMKLPLPQRNSSGSSGRLLVEPLAEDDAAAETATAATAPVVGTTAEEDDMAMRRNKRSLTVSEPTWLESAAAAPAAASEAAKPRRAAPAAEPAEKMIEGTCRGKKGLFPERCVQSLPSEFGVVGLPTPADWDAITADARTLVKRQGELIIRQGDDHDNDVVYVIQKGQCLLRRRDADGAESDVGVVQQPELVGEMQFLLDSRAPYSIYAASDELVLTQLRAESLKALFDAQPKLGGKFFKYVACALERRLRGLHK
jgi:CRP-like cAMP-binding protein